MMQKISSARIISLGPDFRNPQGGIAQVLNSYSQYVYHDFNHITTSGGNNKIMKLWIFFFSLLKLLFICLFNNKIATLHIHSASGTDFKRNTFYIRIGRLFHKKIVLHMHGGGFKEYFDKNERFVRKYLNQVDSIIALSDYWKTYFMDKLGYDNVYVVHNIIPKPNYKTPCNREIFNLLYLGHIYPKKGIFDLVDLLLQDRKEYVGKLRLHIGGGLFDVEVLKKIIAENHLEDIIIFHGWVSGSSKTQLLCSADAYILPSYAEGVPISILEAMSYHLPIISTRVGGIPSIVKEDNGILIEPGNKTEMKKAIDRLLLSKSTCQSLGEKSYEMSLSYQPENVIKELSIVYNHLGVNIK